MGSPVTIEAAGGEHKPRGGRRIRGSPEAETGAEPQQRRGTGPYFFSTLGFGLATPASWLYFFVFWSGSPLPVVVIPLIPSTILVLLGAYQLLRGRTSAAKPGSGAEKQLLMVMREFEGPITPVEAALGTSLTVDEAEEILSRLADRGHLTIESRDGALSYALPGRR